MKKLKLMLIIPAVAALLCTQVQAQITVAGELIVDLDTADLAVGATNWVNNATSTNSVGDFADAGGALNVVTALSGTSNRIANAVYVGNNNDNALTSAITNAPLSLLSNSTCSVEAWIFAEIGSSLQDSTFVSWGQGAENQQRDFRYESDGNGMLACYFNVCSWGGAVQPLGRWVHAVITYDATDVFGVPNTRGYIDGQLVSSQTLSKYQFLNTLSSAIRIGTGTGGAAFEGYIGDVRIHTGVLDDLAVANNFAEGMAVPADLSPTIANLDDIEVLEGLDVTFSPIIAGGTPIDTQWSVNGSAIVGATNSTLTLTNVTTAMSGNEYTLVASSVYGAATNSAILTVNAVSTIDPPWINVDIGNSVYSGTAVAPGAGTFWNGLNNSDLQVGIYDSTNGLLETVTLWVRKGHNDGWSQYSNDTKGDPNPLNLMKDYCYTFNATGYEVTLGNIPNEEYLLYVFAHGDNPGGSSVTIDGVTKTQVDTSTNDYRNIFVGGPDENYLLFSVTVTNQALEFRVNNNLNGFQLVPANAAPFFIGPTNVTGIIGMDTILDPGASAIDPTYQWELNGTVLAGETNSTLTLSAVQKEQEGDVYTVTATTPNGNATHNIVLSVDYPGSIDSLAINAASNTATIVWSTIAAAADAGLTFDISRADNLINPTWTTVATNLVPQVTGTNEVPLSGDSEEFFTLSY